MRILCICDQGNNRSVTFASQLKYWGNDCISAGLKTNSFFTLKMLYNWAELIILTENNQEGEMSLSDQEKEKYSTFGCMTRQL